MESNANTGLQGLKIVSFESRRAKELAELLRRHGADPIIAPSMREVPLSQNSAAFDFLRQLEEEKVDIVIFLTGVGTRTLVEAVASEYPRERLAAVLGRTTLVARGPKPVAALKELGLQPAISVPEPNTWREILLEIDSKLSIRGRRVAVQEYGITNLEFIAGLEARGAEVLRVPVYRWALPEDTGPLVSALREIMDSRIDIALFTNATQVTHLAQLAAKEGLEETLQQAFSKIVVASIGPVCSEALEHFGFHVDIEPEHPKMGYLVAAVAAQGSALVRAKQQKDL